MGGILAFRAYRRSREAERRSEDMERLQRLGHALLTRNTLAEAAEYAVHQVVELFGVNGVEIRIEGDAPVRAGDCDSPEEMNLVALDVDSHEVVLVLFGGAVTPDCRGALGHLIGLSLGRARALEERSRIEGERRGEELRAIVLNGLAQHFRTPLTSIKAAATTLRGASYIPEGPGKELAQIIDEEADRLDRLIGESLRFARIESHRISPRREACSLADITAKVISRLACYLGGRELVVKVSQDLPTIQGDRFLLEQMLYEIVDNAWKYSRPGSSVRIEAFAEADSVILTVRTQGDEISENERELIFAKFYRGAVHRSQIEGTGIGLAVARAIADAHRGSIRLDSEPGGQTFSFSLPAGK